MIYDTFCARRVVDVDISSANHTVSCADGLGPRALWVGGAGTVIAIASGNPGGTSNSYTVPAGSVIPIEFCTIVKASTTATEMKFLY